MNDTIVALATPPGRGGVAVIRLSGPQAFKLGCQMTKKTLKPRSLTYSKFYALDDTVIDQGLVLFFKGPNSFTGEDVIEFQGHGSPLVVDLLIQALIKLGARMAEPGEFSKRAFLNDKMDLTQAEAIADLIEAGSQQAAQLAMKSLQGDFSKKINALIDELIRLRVFVEAAIDFPEEEIDFLSDSHVGQQLASLIELLQELLANAREGRLLKEGIHLVIAGLPNVGKSTLLNALAEEELAIVTNVPGTTRDLKGETISIDGIPVHVVDTAGIRETDCVVEQEGIKRTFKELKKADCVLHLKAINDNASMESGLSQEILEKDLPVIEVINKADLCQDLATKRPESLFISAKEGVGISDLKQRIKTLIGVKDLQGEGLILARRRHILALDSAQNALITGQKQLKEHKAGELLAEDLKLATDALSEITGGISADQLLGQIFSSFCIGK